MRNFSEESFETDDENIVLFSNKKDKKIDLTKSIAAFNN
jgi:hypothetical protein